MLYLSVLLLALACELCKERECSVDVGELGNDEVDATAVDREDVERVSEHASLWLEVDCGGSSRTRDCGDGKSV